MSARLSITLAASSAARALAFGVGFRSCFTVRPSSTSRRIASENFGVPGCFSAHLTTAPRNSAGSRMAVTGSCPVAGRPGRFCNTFFAGFISYYINFCPKSKPRRIAGTAAEVEHDRGRRNPPRRWTAAPVLLEQKS